jgi:lambda repressor-like predicted transcriptional regulator
MKLLRLKRRGISLKTSVISRLLEASVVKMKMQIAKLVGVTEKQKWNWNPDAY